MLLDEVGVLGHGVAQRVEERGLQPREGVVEAVDVGSGEAEGLGVALLGQAVDDRTARIGESHHFGTLIEGFTRGVVNRRADNLHLERGVHPDNLRVSAADEQAEEREVGVGQLAVRQVEEVRKDVALEVVDLHHRDVVGDGEPLGERNAHEQRTQQAGAAREGDGIELVGRDAGLLERRIHHRNDVLLVGARGQLGNHASVLDVNGL